MCDILDCLCNSIYLNYSTSGVPFESEAISVTIPARSLLPVTMTGKALEAGSLHVRGCKIQLTGGKLRESILPLSTDEEHERRTRRKTIAECELGRIKYSGLETRPWECTKKRVSRLPAHAKAPPQFLEADVVPEQPLLRVRRTSLTHGAMMLYEGET